ncbi:MAG: sodium-dependent transporter [Opitutales bacterium]|nr:sodium-dependent transporter [Opitutales bacterium]MCH8540362.1 sodium-dependent transporter [Opitutales bacterium]
MEQSKIPSRGQWGSRLVFIFAAAGSAVGLGNIWGFPMNVAQNGGGAFVLVYLFFMFVVGFPVMLAEMVLGRAGEKNPVGALKNLKKGTPWYLVGGLGVFTGFVILSFYIVISGWTVFYFFQAAGGNLILPEGTAEAGVYFEEMYESMTANAGYEVVFMGIFLILTAVIVAAGVRTGIERAIKISMPLLLIILLILMFRALTLEGAGEGLKFYLVPDFSQLTFGTLNMALGQAFFSLSLGMGVMITYGSYLSKKENLPTSAGQVVSMDVVIAILAGLIIFPVIFFTVVVHGGDLDSLLMSGMGLVFQVFPQILGELPGGDGAVIFFSSAFFLLLGIAALTSAISILEVITAHLVDDWKIGRRKAAWLSSGAVFVVAIPTALGFGASAFFTNLPFAGGMSVFEVKYLLTFQILLPVGALGLSLFVGWVWGIPNALKEIQHETPTFVLKRTWCFMIRYVAPIAILIVLGSNLVSIFLG